METQKNNEEVTTKKILHVIKCRFCDTPTGSFEITVPLDHDGETSDEMFGIEDSRCDACQTTHGSYKQMHDDFIQSGGTVEEFKEAMQTSGFKKSAHFDIEKMRVSDRLEKKMREESEIPPPKVKK